MDVAFRNPDGSTVLVAHNENSSPQAFAVQEGDQRFSYTLPGYSMATFAWTADLAGPGSPRLVAPDGWTATASPPGPANPCCTCDVAANAVDGDASTRYSTPARPDERVHRWVIWGTAARLAAGRLAVLWIAASPLARQHDIPVSPPARESAGIPGEYALAVRQEKARAVHYPGVTSGHDRCHRADLARD